MPFLHFPRTNHMFSSYIRIFHESAGFVLMPDPRYPGDKGHGVKVVATRKWFGYIKAMLLGHSLI